MQSVVLDPAYTPEIPTVAGTSVLPVATSVFPVPVGTVQPVAAYAYILQEMAVVFVVGLVELAGLEPLVQEPQ